MTNLDWLFVLIAVGWPTGLLALVVGTLVGLYGCVAGKDWHFRVQSLLAGVLCAGGLSWFWLSYISRRI